MSRTSRGRPVPGASGWGRWWASRAAKVWLLVLLAGAIVWGAYSRRHTVATGIADILHYYRAAHDFLAASTWEARLQAALTWAPLHPLVLATVIHWFGAEWTYFLGPLYFWGVLVGLGAWSWRISGEYRGGVMTLLVAGGALLFGFSENVNFLLYPFREAFAFLFLVAGMYATVRAYPAGGRWHYALLLWAGCSYVLAAAVREPTILAISGALAYVAVQPRRSLWERGGDVLVLLLPLLMALTIMAVVFARTGIMASHQFSGWQRMTAGLSLAAWRGMLSSYANWLLHLLGPWGSLCIVVGLIWMARRNWPAVLMLVLSLLSVVALYATFAFYPRYALSVGLFLMPFLGLGFWKVVQGVGWLAGRMHRWLEHAVFLTVAAALLIFCGVRMSQLPPGEVSSARLATFREAIQDSLETCDGVLTDARSRLLNEVLFVHLGIQPRNSLPPVRADEPAQRFLFLKPANDAAVVQAKLVAAPVSLEMEIMRHADVEELVNEDGTPAYLSLGAGVYRWCRVQPWSRQQVEEDFALTDMVQGMLWLDFQESAEDAVRTVLIVDETGATVAEYPVGQGNGLIPFALDGERVPRGGGVRVVSSSRLPARLLVRRDPEGALPYFVLEANRRPSVLKWLAPPTGIAPQEKWAATLFNSARFRLPMPRGAGSNACHFAMLLEPRHQQEQPVVFTYHLAGAEDLVVTNSLHRHRFWQEVPLPCSGAGDEMTVDMTVDVPSDWPNHFRVVGLSVRRTDEVSAP